MDFRATTINGVILLLIALAIYTLYFLLKRKLDSNVPLFFYCAVMAFMTVTERELNTPLILCGLFAALVLRFEFMNSRFMNVFWTIEVLAVAGIAYRFFGEAFSIIY